MRITEHHTQELTDPKTNVSTLAGKLARAENEIVQLNQKVEELLQTMQTTFKQHHNAIEELIAHVRIITPPADMCEPTTPAACDPPAAAPPTPATPSSSSAASPAAPPTTTTPAKTPATVTAAKGRLQRAAEKKQRGIAAGNAEAPVVVEDDDAAPIKRQRPARSAK